MRKKHTFFWRLWPCLLFSLILTCFAGQLRAAEKKQAPEPVISVKAELDNAFITIGSNVTYTITVKHSPEVKILSALDASAGDILEIKNVKNFKRSEDGLTVEGRTITMTAFRLGEFILDPVRIDYRINDGEIKSIETNRSYLTVESVFKDPSKKAEDIRGVKGVLTLEIKYRFWILTGLAVLLSLILFFYFYQQFKKQNPNLPAPVPVISPEKEAMQALNELFDSDLLKRGLVKVYFFKFSEILRIYFEKRYRIQAVESTTYEIMLLLKDADIDSALRRKINDVLESADLAKFAKWKPEPAMIMDLNKKAREIITESTSQAGGSGGN